MKFGYWTPVWGSWLRNVDDDSTECSWDYVLGTARAAEAAGYALTLVPELYLNDIKGQAAPVLDAWASATALAAVTEKMEILAALRPQYHPAALTAKQIATIAQISGGRFSVNLVSAWWKEEARQYGIGFDEHDDRYTLVREYVEVLRGFWTQTPFSYKGKFFEFDGAFNEPKPAKLPLIYAGGESETGRENIAHFADRYLMHGGTVAEVAAKIADMKARRERLGREAFGAFGMAAYVIIRETEREAMDELRRITTIKNYDDYASSYRDFTGNSRLDVEVSRQEYSVSNRGLRPGLVGTAEQVAERVYEYEKAGLDLIIVQCSNVREELVEIARKLRIQ